MSDRLQKTKFLIKNDTEKDKKEQLNKSNETPEEDERDKYLNNQKAFRKKRDFFSFYSKNRRPTTSSEKPNLQLNKLNPEDKRFSAIDLMPRGFGVKKIKERIEFFEKSMLEKEYKINALNEVKKKFYDNEPRRFDLDSIKVQTFKEMSFNNTNKHNNNIQKNNLKLIVDYSKIINSSKINRKQKELDIFLKSKQDKKVFFNNDNFKENQDQDLSLSLNSLKEDENSTNVTRALNPEKNNTKINTFSPKHRKRNSGIYCYSDLMSKITEEEKKETYLPKYEGVIRAFNIDTGVTIKEGKKDKYILVKKTDNKISVEKKHKYKSQSIKKVMCDTIPDNLALDRFTKAKYNLNNANHNKILKNQIFEIFDKIIIDNNIKSKKQNETKTRKQKFIKAIKIMPQLLLVKQKINSLLINNENIDNNDDDFNLNEKDIKTYISSIYFLNCIGLDPSILFRDKEKIESKNFINDIDDDIKINGINNKKMYIRYYFRNLNKANLFLEILIDIINKIQIKENIYINK
jgi:hypothetical protein